MGDATGIAWADSTFNPWAGCTKVSAACDHCYAEADADHRRHFVRWGPHAERRRTTSTWRNPPLWNRKASEFERLHGRRRRVFGDSWCDIFDNQAPPEWRADFWRLVRATPCLDWLLLTKRPQNIAKMLPPDWGEGYENVWLGATTENQEEYDRRWPILARTPAAVRFVSYEPALGPLTLAPPNGSLPDWLICGGESGPHPRMMDPAWARSIRDQCGALGVWFFMKQMTGREPIPADLMVRAFPRPRKRPGTQTPAPE